MNLEEADSLSNRLQNTLVNKLLAASWLKANVFRSCALRKSWMSAVVLSSEALSLLERTYLIEIFPRRGAIVSEMSAQQVKALFDTNVMVLGHIVQRISETWRVNEAEQLQALLDQLMEFVRAGDIGEVL